MWIYLGGGGGGGAERGPEDSLLYGIGTHSGFSLASGAQPRVIDQV